MLRTLFSTRTLTWLVLAGLTLETCARLEDTLRYGAPFQGVYDSDGIYTYGANGKQGRPHAAYLKWKLNEAGFRGPALRHAAYRIVCLGASETFGLYESEGAEWPRRLEHELNRSTPRRSFEVVNAAYPGMTLANNLRQLDDTIDALHPGMVLVYPSYTGYIEPGSGAPLALPKRRWEFRMRSRLDTLLKRSLPDDVQDALRKLELKLNERHVAPEERVPDSVIARFENDLDRLTTDLRARGIDVVLITHATRFGGAVRPEERRFLIAWRKFYPRLAEAGFLDMEQRMRDAMLRVGARASAPVIDAATLLPPGSVNFVDFSHFTDQGAGALAALVAGNLRTLLPAAARVLNTAAVR